MNTSIYFRVISIVMHLASWIRDMMTMCRRIHQKWVILSLKLYPRPFSASVLRCNATLGTQFIFHSNSSLVNVFLKICHLCYWLPLFFIHSKYLYFICFRKHFLSDWNVLLRRDIEVAALNDFTNSLMAY